MIDMSEKIAGEASAWETILGIAVWLTGDFGLGFGIGAVVFAFWDPLTQLLSGKAVRRGSSEDASDD